MGNSFNIVCDLEENLCIIQIHFQCLIHMHAGSVLPKASEESGSKPEQEGGSSGQCADSINPNPDGRDRCNGAVHILWTTRLHNVPTNNRITMAFNDNDILVGHCYIISCYCNRC